MGQGDVLWVNRSDKHFKNLKEDLLISNIKDVNVVA